MPGLYIQIRFICPHCGHSKFHMRKGFHIYARFICHNCTGTFFRAREIRQKPLRKH